MSMIRTCAAEGCVTLTLGERCIEHEAPISASSFPRGRPHRPARASSKARTASKRALVVLAALGLLIAIPSVGRSSGTATAYPMHTNIIATVFWIGEPIGNGSTENNAISAYDDRWEGHFGGVDDYGYVRRYPYFPRFTPHENPFYLDLPYDDFLDGGSPRPGRTADVPWARADAVQVAAAAKRGNPFSLMKNRWVEISHTRNGSVHTCYGQIEDAGPYVYDDVGYVFGRDDRRPRSRRARNAGMDVSPALRDCLAFSGLDNDSNRVDWRFVDQGDVPAGPWLRVVTTRQVFWP